jgi:hypothetical protein
MSPSEKSLLQRALNDRKQQVLELATSSNALSDLGVEIFTLSNGPQKTRMVASLDTANSLIKKQLFEASLMCMAFDYVTSPSTDGAGEKRSGSILTHLKGIVPSVHGDMTL